MEPLVKVSQFWFFIILFRSNHVLLSQRIAAALLFLLTSSGFPSGLSSPVALDRTSENLVVSKKKKLIIYFIKTFPF